jgi:hypothetical protein
MPRRTSRRGRLSPLKIAGMEDTLTPVEPVLRTHTITKKHEAAPEPVMGGCECGGSLVTALLVALAVVVVVLWCRGRLFSGEPASGRLFSGEPASGMLGYGWPMRGPGMMGYGMR